MLKTFRRQLISILLVLMLAVSVLPLSAFAETVSGDFADGNIQIRSETGNKITITNSAPDSYKVSAEGYDEGGCWGDKPTQTNLYIKNISADQKAKVLTFKWTAEAADGYMSLNGTLVEPSAGESDTFGPYILPYDEEVFISIDSGDGEGSFFTIKVSDVQAPSIPKVGITVVPAVGGSLKADLFDVVAEGENTLNSSKTVATGDSPETIEFETLANELSVTAISAEGYTFLSLVDGDGNILTTSTNYTYTEQTSETSITARFYDSSKLLEANNPNAKFQVGTGSMVKYYVADLATAFDLAQKSASKVVIPLLDMTFTENITVPAGVTLLIPFDDAYTCYKETPAVLYNTYEVPTPYRILTLAEGVKLTIADGGAVSLSSKLASKGQFGVDNNYNGTPTGPDGRIEMKTDSEIVVKNGGCLYAWGYIYGTGSVQAQSGAKVYEAFQIKDWRGGTATRDINSYAFIFSQYYVQNIEVPMTLYSGATETLYSSVNASSSAYPISVDFIGKNSGMFQIKSGYLIKDYIEDTDRIDYDLYGSANIAPLVIKGVPLLGEVSTSDYRLPLNSNMTIAAKYGTTNITQNVEMLPGVTLTIDSGATMNINEGCNVYLFDHDEWVGKLFTAQADLYVVGYSVANGTIPKRLSGDVMNGLVDAKIVVDGTLNVNGKLYTSEHGADITSSAGGTININQAAPAGSATIYEMANNSTKTAVTFYAAQLHNAQSRVPYTATAGSDAGTVYKYDTSDGVWYTGNLVKWKYADGLAESNANVIAIQDRLAIGDTPDALEEDPTFEGGMYDSYTFTGWEPADAPKAITEEKTSYYANFTPSATLRTYTVTWYAEDGTTDLDSNTVNYGATYLEGGEEPDNYAFNGDAPTKSGYTLYTWQYSYTPYGGTEAVTGFVSEDGWPTVTADVTFTPVFRINRYVYHVNRYYSNISNGITGSYSASTTAGYGDGGYFGSPAAPNASVMNGDTYVLPTAPTHHPSANPKTYDLTQVANDFKYTDKTFLGWYVTTANAAAGPYTPRYDTSTSNLAIGSYTPEFLYQKYLDGKIILATASEEERTIKVEATTVAFAVYELSDIFYYRNAYYTAGNALTVQSYDYQKFTEAASVYPNKGTHTKTLAATPSTTLVNKTTDYKYTHTQFLGWYVTDVSGNSLYKDGNNATVTKEISKITPEYLKQCYDNGYYTAPSTSVTFTGTTYAYAIYTNDTTKTYKPLFYDASANTKAQAGVAMASNPDLYEDYDQTIEYGAFPRIPVKKPTTTQTFYASSFYYGAAASAPANNSSSGRTSISSTNRNNNEIPRAVSVNGTTGSYTYSVYYTAQTRYYTAKYYKWDGTQLAVTSNTKYNNQPSKPSAVTASSVVRQSDLENSYTFDHWEVYVDGVDTGTQFAATAKPPALTADNTTYIPVYTVTPIFNKHSLTAGGDIGVNFYLRLPTDKNLNPNTLYVDFSWGSNPDADNKPFTYRDNQLTAANLGDNVTYYVTSAHVAAKELNDTITVNVCKNDGTIVATQQYKASDYLHEVIDADEGTYTEAHVALCKAMLTYGRKAQIEFNYNTENLCPEYDYTPCTLIDVAQYAVTSGDYASLTTTDLSDDGKSESDYYGLSLTLKSSVQFNVIFWNRSGMPLTATAASGDDTYTVTRVVMDGYSSAQSDGVGDYVSFNILDIPVAKLGSDITLTVGENTFTVNPMSYVYSALYLNDNYKDAYVAAGQGTALENLVGVVTALYNYNQMAVAYFN